MQRVRPSPVVWRHGADLDRRRPSTIVERVIGLARFLGTTVLYLGCMTEIVIGIFLLSLFVPHR